MKNMLLFVLVASVLSGCVTINQNLLLDKGTKLEIIDISTTSFVSTALASSPEQVDIIKKRIMELTREELAKRSIEAMLEPTPGAAKLKYDIRTVSSGYQIIGSGYPSQYRQKVNRLYF